jgi:hypothetical protein
MKEFKGTQGEWEYEVDLDYDQGGNAIGLGPVVEVNGEVILKGITRDGTVEGCNFKDVRLAAAAPKLLEALQELEEAARQVMAGEMAPSSIMIERIKAQDAIKAALNL